MTGRNIVKIVVKKPGRFFRSVLFSLSDSISEISENRIKAVRDELKEGDQILVKVLALEGNKIKLSRKAVLREQREKLKTPVATA